MGAKESVMKTLDPGNSRMSPGRKAKNHHSVSIREPGSNKKGRKHVTYKDGQRAGTILNNRDHYQKYMENAMNGLDPINRKANAYNLSIDPLSPVNRQKVVNTTYRG